MAFVKDLAERYWQMVIPSIFATAVGVLLPGDYPPVIRIVIVAVLVFTFASGRLYQDRWAQRRGQLQSLHERLLGLAREFKHFLSSTESHTRDVSVFIAAAQLQGATAALQRPDAPPCSRQLVADWAYGMAQRRSVLDDWHFALIKGLELDVAEGRYTPERLRRAFQDLSHLAVAHEIAIEDFRRECRRPEPTITREVLDKFDRLPPEYNLWVQQFRSLSMDATQALGGNVQPFSLNPQSPLGVGMYA